MFRQAVTYDFGVNRHQSVRVKIGYMGLSENRVYSQ